MKLWKTPLNTPLRSSRLVRRVIIDHDLEAGWPVKWGKKWDIAIKGELVPTGLTSLDWTGQQWIDFINKYNDEQTKSRKQTELIP